MSLTNKKDSPIKLLKFRGVRRQRGLISSNECN